MCRVNYRWQNFLVEKWVTTEAPPSKTYTLLTSVYNDVNDADNADDYNRVIGISKCEQNFANTQTSKLGNYNKLSHRPSLKMDRK